MAEEAGVAAAGAADLEAVAGTAAASVATAEDTAEARANRMGRQMAPRTVPDLAPELTTISRTHRIAAAVEEACKPCPNCSSSRAPLPRKSATIPAA